jgi:PIN domain nuclease of toxin-antitoxin system
MRYVLDACALLALIKKEDGALSVRQALESENNVCLVHSVNLCEVYSDRHEFEPLLAIPGFLAQVQFIR